MDDTQDPVTHFLKVGQAAASLLGADTASNRARIIRLVDRGELACIRVGDRRDRLVPASEINRLQRDAESNLRSPQP